MPVLPPISESERLLLKALWELGPVTVREVLDHVAKQGVDWAYTTVQTMLNRLVTKEYVAISRGTAHLYQATYSRDQLLQQQLTDLADTYCEGTTSPLMLALVEGKQFSAEEIASFRELLDRLEGQQHPEENNS
ncbi:MAG: BlaI/MecI/CopY family transcriptional regulator [Zavarzinella sp.]